MYTEGLLERCRDNWKSAEIILVVAVGGCVLCILINAVGEYNVSNSRVLALALLV